MTLPQAILATLTYSDHFSFPLTSDEIYIRLVGADPCARPVLIHHVNQMVQSKQIAKTSSFYHLPNRSKLVQFRKQREEISLRKLLNARKIAKLLSLFPTVIAIYVTGSLAVHNAKDDDDIDLMLIIRNHRLWITRLLLTGITELFGLRRHPLVKTAKDKVCLNLYLTPNAFLLPKHKHSLYTAYELIQAVPLHDPHNTHMALLSANKWLNNYLPNFPLPMTQKSDLPAQAGHVDCKPDQEPTRLDLVGYIEQLAYKLQTWYMRKKMTSEYITPDAAFFHPHNPGASVLKKLDELK